MNPAYRHARFRAELPSGGLPESFAVITACNPEGKTVPPAENETRIREFQGQLVHRGLGHFPVTGFDPRSPHEEAGFGVLCDLETAYAMGKEWRQKAVFWIHRGEVNLIHCGPQMEPEPLKRWADMADAPADHPRFHFRGPLPPLAHPATAFLCSTRCPAEKIAEIYDWARQQCDAGGTVISGFHTPVEQDVLTILARRGANILWATARDVPKALPKHLKSAFDEGRLMILSPFDYGGSIRPTRISCSVRNRFVLDHTASHYVPYIAAGSALMNDVADRFPFS